MLNLNTSNISNIHTGISAPVQSIQTGAVVASGNTDNSNARSRREKATGRP